MSHFFTQQWAIDADYLLKMEMVVKNHMGLVRSEELSLFSNSAKNTPSDHTVMPNAAYKDEEVGTRKNSKKKKNIRVIPVKGAMFKKAGMIERASGLASTSQMVAWIEEANAIGSAIDAILLDIDSPGGAVDGTETLGNAIANSTVPVIAFVNGMAASAAYWIASQAKEVILSEQNAQVGSIGVIYTHVDQSGWVSKEGFKVTDIVSDKAIYKSRPSGNRPLDEEDIASVKSILNPMAENFEETVKRGRGEVKDQAFNGQMFVAEKAIDLNLANRVGTFADALQRAAFLSTQQPPNKMNESAAVEALKEQFDARLNEKNALIAALEEDLNDREVLKEENEQLKAQLQEWEAKYATLEEVNTEVSGQLAAALKELDKTPETPPVGVEVEGNIDTGVQGSWQEQPWNKEKQAKLARLAAVQQRKSSLQSN